MSRAELIEGITQLMCDISEDKVFDAITQDLYQANLDLPDNILNYDNVDDAKEIVLQALCTGKGVSMKVMTALLMKYYELVYIVERPKLTRTRPRGKPSVGIIPDDTPEEEAPEEELEEEPEDDDDGEEDDDNEVDE